MKTTGTVVLCALLVFCSLALPGCGQKADENKPIDEVRAEAEKMDGKDLRAAAETYKNALVAKKGELEKIAAKLKEIPVTEMMGEKSKSLKADIESLSQSADALTERFDIYYEKLKEKGGDVSGLQM
jgi:uncharacterized coiled-coil DUF342 family protein